MHRRQRATPTRPAWARPVRLAPRRPRCADWSSIREDRQGFRPADGSSSTSAPGTRGRQQLRPARRRGGESGSKPSSVRRDTHQYVADLCGSGKTFVACALAHQACRQHQSVLYRRVPELVAAVIRARDKGSLERLMGRWAGSPCWSSTTGDCRASPPRAGATCWRSWRRVMDASPSLSLARSPWTASRR